MDAEDRKLLRGLLAEERLLALGVIVDGEAVVGLLPFAPAEDLRSLYVQASALARHSRGLSGGARFSAVIHRPDSRTFDPLQTPRLVVEGTVDPLERGRPEREGAVEALLARFPSAAMTLNLPDFKVFRLEMTSGRLVSGFGRALNLTSSHFADVEGGLSV